MFSFGKVFLSYSMDLNWRNQEQIMEMREKKTILTAFCKMTVAQDTSPG